MCVLFVDDEPLLREVVADYLSDCGFDVLTAADGAEAIALIDRPPRHFTFLLTDFNMPGAHNGCDVADRMRAVHPHVHVFIVTGRPDLIAEAREGSADYAVIRKPFDLKRVAAQLASFG